LCPGGTLTTPSVCAEICGDGVITPSEQCEDNDGGPSAGDGCDATCFIETGYTCVNSGNLSVCTAVCGNGKK